MHVLIGRMVSAIVGNVDRADMFSMMLLFEGTKQLSLF